MESQVWVKVSLFLKELRCEDIKRNSVIHLESCQKEKKALKIFRQVWEKEQKNLSELQQRAICNYIEQMQAVSFEEQQEAYCQGVIDCVQILSGLGLLESDEKIKRAIEKVKMKERLIPDGYEPFECNISVKSIDRLEKL